MCILPAVFPSLLSALCNTPCPYPHRYLLFYVEYAVQDKPDSLSPEAAVRRGGDACAYKALPSIALSQL